MGTAPELSVAVVMAHPDDDAYGLAGSVALHARNPEFRFILIHATDGGAGEIAPGVEVPAGMLGEFRRREDDAAWRAHGRPPDRHDWFGYPDGGVAAVPFGELTGRIARILREEQPRVVCTFGPDGITGHPDHIAVGAASDAAFHLVRSEGGHGMERLLHGALRESTFLRWNKARREHGLEPWDRERVYHLRPVPDDTIGVEVDTRSVAGNVLAGLREHQSQRHVIMADTLTREQQLRVLGRESYVLAWPPRRDGAPLLADIFEAL
ncbi:Mycothiol S-conjugate amidase [Arthrobacter sp. SO5]|uniref:PIG-L deacetylase family protein n=1 Tax=Arthrobacter sp. SO5 TaxID=1897055 RepID=UPI001E5ACC66|nr:PIG-L family deacetylase [Arthrobacter sp. SO5]MCB5272668.1 Mycothiol S-conjugate amidase [Arthrobacter sp. SO5]